MVFISVCIIIFFFYNILLKTTNLFYFYSQREIYFFFKINWLQQRWPHKFLFSTRISHTQWFQQRCTRHQIDEPKKNLNLILNENCTQKHLNCLCNAVFQPRWCFENRYTKYAISPPQRSRPTTLVFSKTNNKIIFLTLQRSNTATLLFSKYSYVNIFLQQRCYFSYLTIIYTTT